MEALYRGKRKDNGEFVYGMPYQCTKGAWLNPIENGTYIQASKLLENGEIILTGVYEVDPSTVGQYTGLTDKNGVRIFRGDRCRDSIGIAFTVVWDDDNARFIGVTNEAWDVNTGKYVQGERRICYVGRIPRVEVIGNIHDKEASQ